MKVKFVELVLKKIVGYVGLPKEAIPHEQVGENEMRTIKENTMIGHKYVE